MKIHINTVVTITLAMLLFNADISAQSKIQDGTVSGSSTLPATGAILEVESANKGLLLSRIALTNTTTWSLAGTSVKGMLVYNTKDTMSGFTGTTAYPTAIGDGTGLYFWDGTGWVATKTSPQDLRLVGTDNHITQDAGAGSNGTSVGTGTDNIAIGKSTLTKNSSGGLNIAIGSNALTANTTGNYNSVLGANAMASNINGTSNVSIGRESMNKNQSGGQNTAIGARALTANTGGNNNVSIGASSSFVSVSGSDNTVIGASAFPTSASGSNNTIIGRGTGSGITTGSENTIIGARITGLPSDLGNNVILADGAGNQRIRVLSDGKTGIGTTTPQKQLHVNGALQVTNELNVGGDAAAAGTAGAAGEVLTSNGAGAAPSWKAVTPAISATYYVQGTSEATIAVGSTVDVPGVTLTHTVPAGASQTLLFTVIGYAVRNDGSNNNSGQGVFTLLQNGTKISSAFASVGYNGILGNLPTPATLLKAITLTNSGSSAVDYTFKVQYAAWAGAQKVNWVPSTFNGYNGDNEAMLTKMQLFVYNN